MRVRNHTEARRFYPSLHLELDPGEEARIGQVDELPEELERVEEPRPKKKTTPADEVSADDEENA